MLSILPTVMVSFIVAVLALNLARQLSEQQIATFEERLLHSKRLELRHYTDMALTSISHLLDPASTANSSEREAEVKRILHSLTYGDDGYFFVYDSQGVNLVHPAQPELEGQHLIDLQDANGKRVIRDLLRIAQEGGGYYRYLWYKPSQRGQEEKLSYAVQVPHLQWMMGTGLYLGSIAQEVTAARQKMTRNIRDTFFIVVGILIVVVFVIVLTSLAINFRSSQLADSRLQDLTQSYMQLQVDQRRSFARELHDGISQLIVSARYRIETARMSFSSSESQGINHLNQGQEILSQALKEVRQISHDLRPIHLDDNGLRSALLSLLEDFLQRSSISIHRNIDISDQRFPDNLEITIYRIVQEALTNVEKHANAQHVDIMLFEREKGFDLSIYDDGIGAPVNVTCHGLGIRNMKERAELIGGEFKMLRKRGAGTTIRVHLPYTKALA